MVHMISDICKIGFTCIGYYLFPNKAVLDQMCNEHLARVVNIISEYNTVKIETFQELLVVTQSSQSRGLWRD